jgi:redox-sensitive bicupin YhaK (pirin superfamily)
MIHIRKAGERGHANHGWLDTYHTFSFADYYDPEHMGYRTLRVLNEDRVAPGGGFGTHGHRDMEIITYVLEGALAHQDSMGNRGVIRPGEVQRMSAGTGVLHSEMNASDQEGVHFLQIWIVPERRAITPGYEQKRIDFGDGLRLIAAPEGSDDGVKIHQDARLYGARLEGGRAIEHEFAPGRHGWLQIARGEVEMNGQMLSAGDGAAISDEPLVKVSGKNGEILLFDLS